MCRLFASCVRLNCFLRSLPDDNSWVRFDRIKLRFEIRFFFVFFCFVFLFRTRCSLFRFAFFLVAKSYYICVFTFIQVSWGKLHWLSGRKKISWQLYIFWSVLRLFKFSSSFFDISCSHPHQVEIVCFKSSIHPIGGLLKV